MDRNEIIKQLAEGELVPLYAKRVKVLQDSGRMTNRKFERDGVLKACVVEIYKKYRRNLKQFVIKDAKTFESLIWDAFEAYMWTERGKLKKDGDVAPILEEVYGVALDQRMSPQEQQRFWDKDLEFFQELILHSPKCSEVYSKVVDEKKKRAYPLIFTNIKVPHPREKGYARERIYGSSLFHVGNHKNPNQSSCRVRGGS